MAFRKMSRAEANRRMNPLERHLMNLTSKDTPLQIMKWNGTGPSGARGIYFCAVLEFIPPEGHSGFHGAGIWCGLN